MSNDRQESAFRFVYDGVSRTHLIARENLAARRAHSYRSWHERHTNVLRCAVALLEQH